MPQAWLDFKAKEQGVWETQTESRSPGGQEQTETQTETRGQPERRTSEKQETRALVPWGSRWARGQRLGAGGPYSPEGHRR